ncbi:MAG: TolC family protein, partial [Planctomycetes bacterium]|nr:TolC family protein [Planctomycetota bacterium]
PSGSGARRAASAPTGAPARGAARGRRGGLLARRPEIRGAEQQLIAANADIGVAKALLYPQVTISAFAGAGGTKVDGESFGPYGLFNIVPAVTLPIFNMGRLRAGVDFNEALAQKAVLRYQQTIKQAFREVSDSLVEVAKRRDARAQQELLAKTLADASQTAKLRYEGGVSSYLEVLDTERQLFNAELELAQAQRDEFLGVVQLYKALGGGWQGEPPPAPAAEENKGGSAQSGPLARG